MSRPSVHVHAGQSVQLRVDPVQAIVGHVCSESERARECELTFLSFKPEREAAAGWRTESDPIWPHNVVGHQGDAIHAVQAALFYFGLLAPVCPVHEAKDDKERLETRQHRSSSNKISKPTCGVCLLIDGVDHDGSRLLQIFCDQRLPPAAVCCCHRDALQSAVRPVDVAMDPIHCDALRSLNSAVNHHGVVRGVASHI